MPNKGNKLGVKWEGFQDSARLTFANLKESFEFADVTLACEDGHAVDAHELILSSSSPFFGNILRRTSHPHPLIYLRGVKSSDLTTLLDFVYVGEATVDQENFESFLTLAHELELTGLTNAAEEMTLQSSGSEDYAQNMNALESNAPLLASNCSRATPARPHSFDYNEDVTAKAVDNSYKNTKVDLEDLDEQINSMICKSRSSLQCKNWECKVCGKEGAKDAMRKHIEAHHITGVVHFCEICGKPSKSRNALTVHKSTNHRKSSQ